MRRIRPLLILYFLTALIGAVATFVLLYYSLSYKLKDGYSMLYGINHFYSYFSCLISSLVSACLFSVVIFPNSGFTRWFKRPGGNGAVALYIAVVGLIFYLLLYSKTTAVGWELAATHVVHGLVPTVYLVLWFFYFRRGELRFVHCLEWLIIPLLYFLYVLARGELLLVYPYFFLNVTKLGYLPVLQNALGILGVFLLLGGVLVLIDRKVKLPRGSVKNI